MSEYFNWFLDVNIYLFFMICWAMSVAVLMSLFDYSYLNKLYNRSWNLPYISDLKMVMPEELCPGNYQKISIGAWSGFNHGCLCSNQEKGSTTNEKIPEDVFFHISDSKNCNDIPPHIRKVYPTCIEIPFVRPYMLHTYKGFDICAKYENSNYFTLAETFNNKLESRIKPDDVDFNQYFSTISKIDMSSEISDRAITDIRFINITITPGIDNPETFKFDYGIDLNDYEIHKIKFDYVMIIKRLKNEDAEVRTNGLKTIRKLINDIHLTNDLWCAYLDISIPFNKITINGNPEFGYKYCNDFYGKNHNITHEDGNHYIVTYRKELFYGDDYFRTKKIIFEEVDEGRLHTKYDFYNWNHGITKIYNNLLYKVLHADEDLSQNPKADEKYKNFFFNNGVNPTYFSPILNDGSYGQNFQPILVYENYLEGIGCFKFRFPRDHINRIDDYYKNLNGVKLLAGTNSIIFIILVLNFLTKALNVRIINVIVFTLTWLLNLISFIIAAVLSVNYKYLSNYMFDYQFYCQNDFSLKYGSSTLPLEVEFLNSIPLTVWGATANAAILFFLFILVSIKLCRICFIKETSTDNQNLKQEIEFQHKKIDQSELGSKVSDLSSTNRKDKYDNDNKLD